MNPDRAAVPDDSGLQTITNLPDTVVPEWSRFPSSDKALSMQREHITGPTTCTDRPPLVSVLMCAYNASPFIGAAIDSVLGQTFEDFELLVVDDGSTDCTWPILSGYDDPRIHIIRSTENQGVVGARNLGFSHVRGKYLAIHDADDISHPTRFAHQVHHLENHPGDVLVSTNIRRLHPDGILARTRHDGPTTPLMLDWMLHLGNPIAFSSTMMRVSALREMPVFLREERLYAEDFDLYVRLRSQGGISRLPMALLIYRVHPTSTSARNKSRMIQQTANILHDTWQSDGFDIDDTANAAQLAARCLAGSEPASDRGNLARLRALLDDLTAQFLESHAECKWPERTAIIDYANARWEQAMRLSLRTGTVRWPLRTSGTTDKAPHASYTRELLIGMVRTAVPRVLRCLSARTTNIRRYRDKVASSTSIADQSPPSLDVAIILERASQGPIGDGRCNAAFALMAQEVMDKYGVRPTYLLDESTSRNPAIRAALRNVENAGRCTVAEHQPSRKRCAARTETSNLDPMFDPTIHVVRTMGACNHPIRNSDQAEGVECPTCSIARTSTDSLVSQMLSRSTALIANDYSGKAQIRLIRNLLAHGRRRFLLHIHLRQGDAGSAEAIARLLSVCTYFFEDLGGLPGDSRKRPFHHDASRSSVNRHGQIDRYRVQDSTAGH